MSDCEKNPLVVPICMITGRLAEFQNLGFGLEKCQKSLNDYLDTKRRIFSRFYFISTDELLSILGSSDPACVQDHMIKVRSICSIDEGNRPTKRNRFFYTKFRVLHGQFSIGIRIAHFSI